MSAERDDWNFGMDVYVSAVARWTASASTDSHADGSTFVGRKTTEGRFAAYPTRTFLADALEATRNKSSSRSINRPPLILLEQAGYRSHSAPSEFDCMSKRVNRTSPLTEFCCLCFFPTQPNGRGLQPAQRRHQPSASVHQQRRTHSSRWPIAD